MSLTYLAALGFTKEELQRRVVERLCQQLMEPAGDAVADLSAADEAKQNAAAQQALAALGF